MATRRPGGPTVSSGRRGYLRYAYGNHYWVPETQADFSKGMIRDVHREALPPGAVYDSADFLLHRPGVAQKRGGTSYAGPALGATSYATSVLHADFPSGPQLVAIADNTHGFKITAGTATDLGVAGALRSKWVFWIGGTKTLAVFPDPTGVNTPYKYDGSAGPSIVGGTPPSGRHGAVYKSRLVLGGTAASPQRLYFSPVPDIESTWDTANSWIDCDHAISGLAALNNTLLVFSANNVERIIGATPPPNSDMDRAPLSPIGCTDARSIVQVGEFVYFANPEGVYMTNGSTPVSLTEQGGIQSYWRTLFSNLTGPYVSAAPGALSTSWTIAAGFFRGFLIVSVLDASRAPVGSLMCNVARRAWWRLTNIQAAAFATGVGGDELYYADADTARVSAMSGIFTPIAANKNDANGTAVTPMIEFAPVGAGPGVKSFGFGRLDYDMRDAAADVPTIETDIRWGIGADTTTTVTESPLPATSTVARKRFTVCRDAQAVTVLLGQQGPSASTEIYAVEVEQRPQSLVGDGVS